MGRPLIVAELLLLLPLNGMFVAMPAAAMPGCPLRLSVSCSTNACRLAPSGYRFQGSATWPVRMLSVRNPGDTASTCFRLSASRLAPASSTKARPTCATRNACRIRWAARLVVLVLVSDDSVVVECARRLYHAMSAP